MKRFYEYDIIELQRRSKRYNMMYQIYVVLMVFVMIIAGLEMMQLLDNINVFTILSDKLIYFSVIFGIMNFFMIIFLWFVMESSYYKILNCFNDLILYFKSKEEKNE